ncbi:TrmH family RNA methyltransferase [Aliifodinibius sp. S!AR15-10]|uniref:TrmH family RNA methyltransferase n=1 Tax=Aliifodinibius sp. S!AR15-10 TaxID=2950437 RepID=UPI002867157B|nr:TrmH family RNA methyltransferase [Aliifodinibius sp. S!AR15-10]MDR8391035.1 TrmH family RNA methyltransferase [Aliifodinibius sp. S!AR15-10]
MTINKLSTKEILENNLARSAPERMGNLKILLHDLRSMHNVGAAFRSADAFGISEILISGITPAPPRPEITKTAIGAEEFVDWKQFKDPEFIFPQLKNGGFHIIGIEQTDHSIHLPDYKPPNEKKLCLVFGNEVTGIDECILPFIDEFVDIPQFGNKHSLNVSVAVGVTLYGFLQKFWD